MMIRDNKNKYNASVWLILFVTDTEITYCRFRSREIVPGASARAGPPSRGGTMSPCSTPSPKKRQLPQIPIQAQHASRDRGKLVFFFCWRWQLQSYYKKNILHI